MASSLEGPRPAATWLTAAELASLGCMAEATCPLVAMGSSCWSVLETLTRGVPVPIGVLDFSTVERHDAFRAQLRPLGSKPRISCGAL